MKAKGRYSHTASVSLVPNLGYVLALLEVNDVNDPFSAVARRFFAVFDLRNGGIGRSRSDTVDVPFFSLRDC